MQKKRVIVLAQVPPPYHGQSVMQSYLVNAAWEWCEKKHVRLEFSSTIQDVGKASVAKVTKLFKVVCNVWHERLRGKIDILYYPPCGPHRVPFYRDILILLLVRWTAGRLVLHFHAGGFDLLQSKLSVLERWLAAAAYGRPDLAIVLLPSLSREVQWINPKRIVVLPNGIRIEEDEPHESGQPHKEGLRILFVGAISRGKGVLDILEAARILADEGYRFHVKMMGGVQPASFEEEVNRQIHTLNLFHFVDMIGVKSGEEKWREFRDADMFCFPTSDTEAMPVVLLEAMQYGLPIVTTRWRAIPDIIRDNVNGLLVPPNDPISLAAALGSLLRSPSIREELGVAGRRTFTAEYTIDRHLSSLEKVLRMSLLEDEDNVGS